MYFQEKNTLKNNLYHNIKHYLSLFYIMVVFIVAIQKYNIFKKYF
jgi:hypothetical protein